MSPCQLPRNRVEDEARLDEMVEWLRHTFPEGFVLLVKGHGLQHRESSHEFLMAATRNLHLFTDEGKDSGAGG